MLKESIGEILNQFSIPIQEVLFRRGLINESKELLLELGFSGNNILIVSDNNLQNIAHKIADDVRDVDNVDVLILDNPYADDRHVQIINQKCPNIDLILAVGSGTINDLCKITSHKNTIPYVVFATAPSMNGYASANASIMIKGHKKSLSAKLPTAIFFDLDVISQAPEELIKAGIGDSMSYYTCYFDWMLSHLVLKTDFNNEVFMLLQPYQDKLIKHEGSDLRDPDFVNLLCHILIISGLAMYLCGGSYPASQGEHLIMHFLEMKYPHILKNYFHGNQIAVSTLTMIDIQEKVLKCDKLNLKDYKGDLKKLLDIFDGDKEVIAQCINEVKGKIMPKSYLNLVNEDINHIKDELASSTISKSDILKVYQRFNLPSKIEDLKINKDIYSQAINYSYLIRNRFTSLDLKV